ncbi:MAG: DUF4275 family protein [Clostridia bacterium]|nr:DUF4275 family protein [Clostridia bacterium]
MKIVQYGYWKLAIDIDKTKEYYNTYEIKNNQANRNFAEYCRNLAVEEKAFFDAFGINPLCCEIEHIGADKKGNFPCGGYYFVCGKYLGCPPEELITIEEFAKNEFIDERLDPRIDVGIFQFDFQCEDYTINEIPEDMPEGFFCIRFWCEEMKWLLPERPEEMMYEPPRFWEVHKMIKERVDSKTQQVLGLEETKSDFLHFFEEINIKAMPLDKKEIKQYKKEWINFFAPKDADIKEIKKICLSSHKYTPFLWHIFSFNFVNCESEDDAKTMFNQQNKNICVIVSNVDYIAYRLENAENITAELLDRFVDVTITASDFSWTYTKTHENTCGPYFYKK